MTHEPTKEAVEAVALVLMEQRFGTPSPVAHSFDRGDARAVLRFLLNNPLHLLPQGVMDAE